MCCTECTEYSPVPNPSPRKVAFSLLATLGYAWIDLDRLWKVTTAHQTWERNEGLEWRVQKVTACKRSQCRAYTVVFSCKVSMTDIMVSYWCYVRHSEVVGESFCFCGDVTMVFLVGGSKSWIHGIAGVTVRCGACTKTVNPC